MRTDLDMLEKMYNSDKVFYYRANALLVCRGCIHRESHMLVYICNHGDGQ